MHSVRNPTVRCLDPAVWPCQDAACRIPTETCFLAPRRHINELEEMPEVPYDRNLWTDAEADGSGATDRHIR
ncbi:MAG TPA: hypothetical protein VFR23_19990 [Jiangellaceae bacterium]|nr:hypothetical protein [Jiangellaceae bacterium]